MNTLAATAHRMSSAPSGRAGSAWRMSYSMGRAGMRSTHALAPPAKASEIASERSSHSAISRSGARFHPTVRMNRSSGKVASPSSSDRWPEPRRRVKSIWNSRSEARTKPWAK